MCVRVAEINARYHFWPHDRPESNPNPHQSGIVQTRSEVKVCMLVDLYRKLLIFIRSVEFKGLSSDVKR